jgi:hypothetical protein
MSERIFNIFVYFKDGIAFEYGMFHHRQHGSDKELIEFLSKHVDIDCKRARRFTLPKEFTHDEWNAQLRLGPPLQLFEEGLQTYRAGVRPIVGITCVDNEVPRIDKRVPMSPLQGALATSQEELGTMEDYLQKYTEGNVFRIDKLIHDDYFPAIKATFNARQLASCCKLLMSFIDTIAFINFGDKRGIFVRWLNEFCPKLPNNVTPEELWEFRNAILHMTNLSSRKVT